MNTNALKHGCCAESTLILKNETLADYQALEATWFQAYNPNIEAEKRLVQELVNADWFSERANRAMASFEAHLFNESPNPADWTDDQMKRLALLTRYKTARNNAVLKARRAIEEFRKNRLREVFTIERHHIYKERHQIYQDKYRTDIGAMMEEMKQTDTELDQLRKQFADLMK